MKNRCRNFSGKIRSGIYSGCLILFTAFLIVSCGTNQNAVKNSEGMSQLYSQVNEKGFEIDHDWAIPLGGNMISLIDNPNFIRFKNDSVNIFLPYFGERHSGGAYGGSGGIEYKGPAGNVRIEENKNMVIVKFSGKQASELLDFIVTIFPDGTASTSVNSSERAAISYRGNVENLSEDE